MTEQTGYQSIRMADLLGYHPNGAESKFAPTNVFYKGVMKIPLPHPRVSIIGSRGASERGLARAKGIARFLVENKAVIVSGLARGIDTAAHKTAIECGGRTIAVLGTPLDRTYPKENAGLQDVIMKNHLAISQYLAGHTISPKDFAIRNRTMAMISDATVIVEAGESSGSSYHGWEMIRLGRPLLVCRENERSEWFKKMTSHGATVLDDPADVLELLQSART